MNVVIEITVTVDGERKIIARESAHITDVSPARVHLAKHVASVGIQLLSGERTVTKELPEHFKD